MAFKMKGHSLPGPNQRKSPATQKTYKDLTDKELTDAIKRNMSKDIFSVPELVIAQDSVTSGVDEHRRRFEEQSKEKKEPTPAKIAPLVMMGAQMLGKKMMEKKAENDSPAKAKLPTDPTGPSKEEKKEQLRLDKAKQDRLDKSISSLGDLPQRDLDGEKITKKKKESTAMSDKIKETSIANYSKTNKALVKAGKPTMTRAKYNKSLGRSEESSI